jgi:hypothetical protein
MANTFAQSRTAAFLGGVLSALLVLLGIYFGSGQLTRFDTPLAAYGAATVFAAFAIGYRYIRWIQRPPTWKYFVASLRLFFKPKALLVNIVKLMKLTLANVVAQRFIMNRGKHRWLAHMSLAWGCLLAFAITFPLSWGWVQFGVSESGDKYVTEFMSMPMFEFEPHSIIGFMMFNGLNIAAVMVLFGVGLAMHRRLFDRGALAVQSLNDLVPLFLLFAVSTTGLMLTASYKLMAGSHFSFISLLHAFTVVLLLLYLPFGKFFHIIQRPAQLGVQYYKEEGSAGPQALCMRSGMPYQSRLHHDDLVDVMREVGIDFGEHQNLSPQEKRRLIALNQAEALGTIPYTG